MDGIYRYLHVHSGFPQWLSESILSFCLLLSPSHFFFLVLVCLFFAILESQYEGLMAWLLSVPAFPVDFFLIWVKWLTSPRWFVPGSLIELFLFSVEAFCYKTTLRVYYHIPVNTQKMCFIYPKNSRSHFGMFYYFSRLVVLSQGKGKSS